MRTFLEPLLICTEPSFNVFLHYNIFYFIAISCICNRFHGSPHRSFALMFFLCFIIESFLICTAYFIRILIEPFCNICATSFTIKPFCLCTAGLIQTLLEPVLTCFSCYKIELFLIYTYGFIRTLTEPSLLCMSVTFTKLFLPSAVHFSRQLAYRTISDSCCV